MVLNTSEKIKEKELSAFFVKCEKESYRIWEDLNFEVLLLKGDIKAGGTLKGAVNHLWLKIKTDIIHSELPAVLKNLLLCEEYHIDRYQQVLEEELHITLKKKLTAHKDILTARYKKLEEMAAKN